MNKKTAFYAASFLFSVFLLTSVMPQALQAQPRSAAAASASTNPLQRTLALQDAEQVSLASFMQDYRQTLGLSAEDELRSTEISTDELQITHHRLRQYHRGIAVADQNFLVHEKAGKIYLAHGELATGLQLEVQPALTAEQALRFALAHIGARSYMWENPENETFLRREQGEVSASFRPRGELLISAPHGARNAEDFRLVYRFDIYAEQPLGRYHVDVDAKTGAIIKSNALLHDIDVPSQGMSVYNGQVNFTADRINPSSYRLREAARGKGIETYDMRRGTNLNSAVDFTNTDANFVSENAQAGVSVHWALEGTYDYYKSVHNRDSFDNRGGKLLAYVHVDNNWFNATWDGTRMRFGDGSNNASPLVTIDIVSHELTHGVTGNSARLIYANESGALNESFSDIFGNAVEFAMLGANGNWDVGEGAVRIRSMSNPSALGDPDTYLGIAWVPSTPTPSGGNDQGGVHSNSGVQNFWFYLLSAGGSGVNDNGDAYNVPALGLAEAEKIAYRNLTRYLTQSSGYFEARLATIYSTVDLYGANSPQYEAGLAAWEAVGVYYPNLAATLVAEVDTLGFLAEAAIARDTSTVTITNLGVAELTLSNFQVSGPGFQLLSAPSSARLAYRASTTVRVRFTPTSPSVVFGALSMSSNDPQRPTHTIALRGKGFAIRPASEGVIYANVRRTVDGVVLSTVDSNTGAGAVLGKTNFTDIIGMSIRPSNNVIYGAASSTNSTTLVRIDAQTGEAYAFVTISGLNLRAIAFDRNDDLYGAHFTNGKLYRINLADGDTTLIGKTSIQLLSGLAIDPRDGSLWAARVGQEVYRVDKTTATATLVGKTGFARTPEIEFDSNGRLFGLTGFGSTEVNDLLQLDPVTGLATKIGSTGFRSAYSLVIRGAVSTAVEAPREEEAAPKFFALAQNHPNPFNPATAIKFYLPASAHATLKVFDLAGREVATLVNGKLNAGEHQTHFEASTLAAGVYLYRLQAGEHVAVRKLLLVK